MNIWITFLPGSAGSTVEAILRKCTDLKTINKNKVKFLDSKKDLAISGATTSHGYRKQWHPCDKESLQNPQPSWISEDNIFTPIVPLRDWNGTNTLKYIKENSNDSNMFYLGPDNDNEEFAAITLSKVGLKKYIRNLMKDYEHAEKWSDRELDKWELRECLSLSWMSWWTAEMKEQSDTAKQLGFTCYDTKYIFENLKQVVLDIIDKIGCKVTDKTTLDEITTNWQQGQDIIWQKWENYVKYKDTIDGNANHDVHLFDEVGLEAMIQYQLRERGIELKCYKLNNFPTSGRITEFYE